jgi:primary-amine oxidase
MFTPFNFHDRDPSRRSAQGVKLDLEADGTKPEYFGGRNEKSVQLKAVSRRLLF